MRHETVCREVIIQHGPGDTVTPAGRRHPVRVPVFHPGLRNNKGQALFFSAVLYFTVRRVQVKTMTAVHTGLRFLRTGNGFQPTNNVVLQTQHIHHGRRHADDRISTVVIIRYHPDRVLLPDRLVIQPDIQHIASGCDIPLPAECRQVCSLRVTGTEQAGVKLGCHHHRGGQ